MFVIQKAVVAVLLCATVMLARAAELTVASPLAVKEAVSEIGAAFERQSGLRVHWVWGGSEAIARRVTQGEVFDVVINTREGLARLAAAGNMAAGPGADFATSGVGVAARSDRPRPDVSTVAGLTAALLAAPSIAISSGASGRYLEALFQRLGVAEAMAPKLRQPPSGTQIGQMLARGEVDLGFQQVTELVHAEGFAYLGPLPAEVQHLTTWSAGVHAGAPQAAAAEAFVRALKAPPAQAPIRRSGMAPV